MRFQIDPDESVVLIHARSTLHPIHTRTAGLEGFVEVAIGSDGAIDPTVPAEGELTLPVTRLRSGNPLQDRELQRRIDARTHPTITGRLTQLTATAEADTFRVAGALTFKGLTNGYEHEMTIAVADDGALHLSGEATFDVRDFGMEPPKILMLRVEPTVEVRVEIVARPGVAEV